MQFINSKDISAHLKGIGYQFTTLQASWLVYQSRNFTLQEKIDAWREIIASMSDCTVKERRNCIQMDSLHDFLREYITLQEKFIRKLEAQNADAVYRYEIRYDTDNSFDGEGNLYSSYDKCLTAAKIEVNDDSDIVEYRINKVWIDQKDKSITAYYNRNSSLMAIDTSIFLSDRECDVEYLSIQKRASSSMPVFPVIAGVKRICEFFRFRKMMQVYFGRLQTDYNYMRFIASTSC